MREAARRPHGHPRLMAAALLLITLNMRAAILGVSPVLGQIKRALALSATLQGLLVSLPVICFGLCALAGPRIARRLGLEVTLAVAMLLLTLGILLRLEVAAWSVFLGTAIIGTAIGLCNVVVPALIKREFPDHIGLMTGLYITTMLGLGAAAAGGTVPLMNATGLTWRWALAIWAIPASIAAVLWGARVLRARESSPVEFEGEGVGGVWRDSLAWQVTLFLGLQSLTFYAVATWLPTLLSDSGARLTTGGALVAVTSAMGIPSSFGISMLAGAQRRPKTTVLVAVGVSAVGLLGLAVSPTNGALVWTLLFGVGQGATLGLSLTFIGLRSPDSRHATQLAGMAQSFGYIVAALGPLFLGDIHSAAGNWTLPMALVAAVTLPQLIVGLGAARPRYVGT